MATFSTGGDFNLQSDLPADIALKAQRINRKQRMAELLLRQGLSGVQNEQHGRFYVAPSPWQHLAKLAEVGAGAYISRKGDDSLQELGQEQKQRVADALTNFQQTAPKGIPALPERYDSPFGEMGNPRPTDAPHEPIIDTPRDMVTTAGGMERPIFDDMNRSMTTPIPMAPAQAAQPPTSQERIAHAMSAFMDPNAPPQLLRAAALQGNMAQADMVRKDAQEFQGKEHALTRELTREQKDADRENALLIAHSKIDQMIGLKLITQEAGDTLKRELATQANETKRDISKQHNETLRAVASMKLEGTDKPKLKPGERMKADGTVEAIPGSDVYVKQSGLHSKDYGALLTMDTKTTQAIKKIDDILDPKNTGAFNSNFGGYTAYLTERLPGATQDVRQKIESIKSDLKTAGLEIIRSGGAIGQMTEREWPIVEKMIDAIDPRLSEHAAREAFQNIKTYLGSIRANATTAYDTEWGETQFYKGKKTSPSTKPQPVIDFKDLPK